MGRRRFAPDQGSGLRGMRHCAPLVAERGPRPLGLARRLLLLSCSGEGEDQPGGERSRPRSALSGAGAESPAPLGAVLLSPGTGKLTLLLASTFPARATARSEERAPLCPSRSLVRTVSALAAQFFGGQRQPFHDQGGNCL